MSGGSFDYLCDAAGIGHLGERRGMIAEMAKALDEYNHPGAAQAAADTRRVLAILEQADELAERLTEVWHDVEWHHSSDYIEQQVHEALDLYATAPSPPEESRPMTTLPSFTGDTPTCTKCGNKGAFTSYRAHGQCLHDQTGTVLGFEPNERLHRQCTRCDYAWDEALAPTLPAPEES